MHFSTSSGTLNVLNYRKLLTMTVSLLINKTMYAGHLKETNSSNKRHLNLSRTAVFRHRFYNLKCLMMRRKKAWCSTVRSMSQTYNWFKWTPTQYTTYKMVEGATKSQARRNRHQRRKSRRKLVIQSKLTTISNHRPKQSIRLKTQARIKSIVAIAVGKTKWFNQGRSRLIKWSDVYVPW